MEVPDGVEVQDVNTTEANFYDPIRDSIVMDKRLKLYPELRQEILDHEVKHAIIHRNSDSRLEEMVKNLVLDVKTDIYRLLGWQEETKQEEEYYLLEIQQPKLRKFHYPIGNILRGLLYTTLGIFLLPLVVIREISIDIIDYIKRKIK